jgi:hypothetical protein
MDLYTVDAEDRVFALLLSRLQNGGELTAQLWVIKEEHGLSMRERIEKRIARVLLAQVTKASELETGVWPLRPVGERDNVTRIDA